MRIFRFRNMSGYFYRMQIIGMIIFQIPLPSSGQDDTADSASGNPVIIIRAYPQQSSFRQPGSVAALNETQLKQQPGYSLLPALNSLPGLRMEERSPGSYRLSIRGSLLRSPFGIRNIKVYVDEFSLTDGGGNTYLNLIDPGNLKSIEIIRGPDGSLFGANTGGVALLNTGRKIDSSRISGGISGGSYGLFHGKLNWDHRIKKYQFSLYQSSQSSDGYRKNSAMQRKYFSLTQRLDYRPGMQLRSFLMFSDLHYQTPGGLTLSQFNSDPAQARPKTATLPGAEQQQAGVYNKTLFGGILHESALGKTLRHVLALSGSKTNFENPFITNYEVRDESSLAIRTYLELNSRNEKKIMWKWNLGMEWQKTKAGINNYDNKAGVKDTLRTSDIIRTRQQFYFTRFSADLWERLIVEASISINNYEYKYLNEFPADESSFRIKNFSPQIMPKFSASFRISEQLVWRATLSRGYSPPSIAEVRPSDNNIYTELQPEAGWNYETGLRAKDKNNRLHADIGVFYFKLQQAIVRRVDTSGAEYFINAGGTKQTGCEVQVKAQIIPQRNNGLFRNLSCRSSLSFYDFRFSDYQFSGSDYSGNMLTGVPRTTLVSSLYMEMCRHLYLFVQYNYTNRLPLNDANSVFAGSYHLLQAKAGWKFRIKAEAEFFIGADNILNRKYSLGNDLNALGGRYYNAAPLRNYFAGVNVSF
jgi:iron complex outermembrane recepter protein